VLFAVAELLIYYIASSADRCDSTCLSVCTSVCPSRSGVLSRQTKIQSCGFTALHGMQTRSSDENLSVRLSVCLSNACIVTKQKKICLDFNTIRKTIYPSFLRRRMVGEGDPFYLKIWVNRPPLERNRRIFNR